MNAKVLTLLVIPGTLAALAGCDGVVFVERPMRPRPVVVVERPGPYVVAQPAPVVVVQAAPSYVEEDAVIGGVVVTPAPGADYVFINGGWFYWHPGFRMWVHAHRPEGWRPGPGVHVYASWGEHPMYRTR